MNHTTPDAYDTPASTPPESTTLAMPTKHMSMEPIAPMEPMATDPMPTDAKAEVMTSDSSITAEEALATSEASLEAAIVDYAIAVLETPLAMAVVNTSMSTATAELSMALAHAANAILATKVPGSAPVTVMIGSVTI